MILYFDPFNGISGDMVLGALIDLGVPVEHLWDELKKLGLEEFQLEARRVERQGLFGVDLRVRPSSREVEGGGREHPESHSHPHEAQTPPHPSDHAETTPHRHAHAHSRGFVEIRDLIQDSGLDPWVIEKSVLIFRRLGEAEARVHRSSLDKVHFHEVGALDSIIDIVGACVGFRWLGVDRFYGAPAALGQGTVTFSHGTWPVPAPATLELIRDYPAHPGPVTGELTTPTGAAILSVLADRGPAPAARWRKSGFGAGDRTYPEIPNMLRLMLGEEEPLGGVGEEEEILLLEANLDDLSPQISAHFMERALEEGALDVFATPIQMKKGRPGLLLSVLCRDQEREPLLQLMFRETTTLGIRWRRLHRRALTRSFEELETEFGPVRVKVAALDGEVVNAAPEFEDLRRLALEKGVPLRRLQQSLGESISRRFFSRDARERSARRRNG